MTTTDVQQLQYALSKAQERNEELSALLKASNVSNDALVEMVLKHEATIKTLTAERDELKERAQFVAGWNEITVGLGEIVKEMKARIDELEAQNKRIQPLRDMLDSIRDDLNKHDADALSLWVEDALYDTLNDDDEAQLATVTEVTHG